MHWLTLDAVDEFLLSRGTLRTRSIQTYRFNLVLFAQAFKELPMAHQPIQKWLNEQKRAKGDSPLTQETVHQRFRAVRAMYNLIWNWHEEDLKGVTNPIRKVRILEPKPKPMRVWSDQEIYDLFTSDLSPRDRALLNLFMDLGPRAGECCSLTWGDVGPGSFIILRGKTGERLDPVSESTLRLLLDLRPPGYADDDHVFIGKKGPLTYWGLYRLVRRVCVRAGITGKRASPHTFRHTFGTLYASADGSQPKVLQYLMGHASQKTTDRYIHNNPIQMQRNHAQCTPLKIIAAVAQANFFEKVDAVWTAENIIQESQAVFVPRRSK